MLRMHHYLKSQEALFEADIEGIVDENMKHMCALVKNYSKNALEKMQLPVDAGSHFQENEKMIEQLHQAVNNALHHRLLFFKAVIPMLHCF